MMALCLVQIRRFMSRVSCVGLGVQLDYRDWSSLGWPGYYAALGLLPGVAFAEATGFYPVRSALISAFGI